MLQTITGSRVFRHRSVPTISFENEIHHVISFWRAAGPSMWFGGPDFFDEAIRDEFLPLHSKAMAGELDSWSQTPDGAYALLLILDQFSRNMFRGDPRSFASDEKARQVATEALLKGFDQKFKVLERKFFYLPFMHSENVSDQQESVRLFTQLGDPMWFVKALDHAAIVFTFGRYPHRNKTLGRKTTREEAWFLGENSAERPPEDYFWR